MINKENIFRAVGDGMGYEVSAREISERVSLLVRTIAKGWKEGYLVGFADHEHLRIMGVWKELAGTLGLTPTQEELMRAYQNAEFLPVPSLSDAELEQLVWGFLDRNVDELSKLTTDLVFAEPRSVASGEPVYWFPLDEMGDDAE